MIENLVMLRCCSFRKKGRELPAKKRNSTYEGLIRICIASFFVLIFALLFNIIFVNKAYAATSTWDGGGGIDTDWSTPTNWSDDAVPGVDDDVFFDDSHGGASADIDITIASLSMTGAYLNMDGFNLTVPGNVINDGQIPNAGSITIGGDLTNSGSIFSHAGNIEVAGETTNSGSIFTDSGGNIILSNTTNNGDIFTTSGGNITINGTLSNTGDVFPSSNQNIIITGAVTNTGGDIRTGGTGTILLQSTLMNTGTAYVYTASGSIDIIGEVTSSAGSYIYTTSGGVIHFSNNVINQNGSYITNDADITFDGTLVNQNSAQIYTSSDNSNLTMTGDVTNTGGAILSNYYNGDMTFGGNVTNSNGSQIIRDSTGTITVIGDFTNITGSSLIGSTGDWDFNGSFTNDEYSSVTATSGTWYIAEDFTNYAPEEGSPSFYHNGGTIELIGANTQHINGTTRFFNLISDNRQKVLGEFDNTTSLDLGIEGHTVEIYNGYIYVLGGYSDTIGFEDYLNTVRYAQINPDGTVGEWVISPNMLNSTRAYHSSAVYNGYLYVIGGYNDDGDYSNIEYAKIGLNGSVGEWTVGVNELSSVRAYQASLAFNGYLYVIGGSDLNEDLSIVEYAEIDSEDGSVGTFSVAGNTFDGGREELVAFIYDDYLYITGGNGDSDYADTQYASIDPNDGSIGAWETADISLPYSLSYSTVAVIDNRIFLIGGMKDSYEYLDSVLYTTIKPDHEINEWQELRSKTIKPTIDHWGGYWNGYVYVVGGDSDNGDLDVVQYAQIDPPNDPTEKILIFESGETTTIEGDLFIEGRDGYNTKIRGSVNGVQAKIDPTGTINVSYIDVKDNNNLNGVYIEPTNSTDSGNNLFWFIPSHYEIVSSVIGRGEITPLGTTNVAPNGSQLYIISPAIDSHLAYLIVDGVVHPADDTYGFTEVMENHTIQAVFCSGVGPCMVKNIDGDYFDSNVSHLTPVGDKLFFITTQGEDDVTLWFTDGTDAGTISLTEGLFNISRLVSFENKLYFTANHMGGQELWTSDGTVEGTHLIEGFYPVDPLHPDELTIIWNLHVGNNVMYLIVSKGLWGEGSLWKSDGTPGGTIFIKALEDMGYSIVFGNSLFYNTCSGGDCDLWISDGTLGGTTVVEHFEDTYEISSFMVFKNEVYFEVQDGMGYKANYKSDGNDTTLLFENPDFGSIEVAGDYIFGAGWDALNGYELWAMDGSVGGGSDGFRHKPWFGRISSL